MLSGKKPEQRPTTFLNRVCVRLKKEFTGLKLLIFE
jgi:hypothetical protein